MKNNKKKNPKYPYCGVCEACGEDGCCSALVCKQHKDGEYCESYLLDLKFGYRMYHDIYELLKDDKESKKKFKKIHRKNHDLTYKIK